MIVLKDRKFLAQVTSYPGTILIELSRANIDLIIAVTFQYTYGVAQRS